MFRGDRDCAMRTLALLRSRGLAVIRHVLWFSVFFMTVPAWAGRGFPSISVSQIVPLLLANCTSYQMADYDAARNQVLFYPYGNTTAGEVLNGKLLVFNVAAGTQNFTNPSDWTVTNLQSVAGSTNAASFGGGFLDASDTYAYMVGRSINNTTWAGQINLASMHSNHNSPSAYSWFDPTTITPTAGSGGFSGIYANGYAYFAPTQTNIFIEFNGADSFSSASSWTSYDLSNVQSNIGGPQSMAYIAPYVYGIPFQAPGGGSASSLFWSYNTTLSFTSASSYQVLDLTTISSIPGAIRSGLTEFTGGVVVGSSLVLVPWGASQTAVTKSVALKYDSTQSLTSGSAWQYIQLTNVDPNAGGYQFGWLDANGFMFFVPTHNFNMTNGVGTPPLVAWDTTLPFSSASSWTSYPVSPVRTWLTGAAYDPTTDTAWSSSYNPGDELSFTFPLTQFQETYTPPAVFAFGSVTAKGNVQIK